MSPHAPRHPHRPPRRGFSLVELMVVIVIIGILAALILPALGSASRTARVTEVQVEIKGLESNITAFKTEFGEEPPSGITLFEEGGAWSVASQTQIRRMWPQFNFAIDRDINGDGDMGDVIVLTGSECLVFFLGGMMATNVVSADGSAAGGSAPVTAWTPLGFSKNPRNPFERSGGTRIGPFQEFDGSRLVDVFSITPTDHDMPEYLDTLPSQANPYLYASSNNGRGYDATDLGGPALSAPLVPVTSMTNVYLQKDDDTSTVGDTSEIAWNQTSFQIISPGFDTEYGVGGIYESDGTLPPARSNERDNITNFGSGELE